MTPTLNTTLINDALSAIGNMTSTSPVVSTSTSIPFIPSTTSSIVVSNDSAVSVALLGLLVFFTLVFYLIQSTFKTVRDNTWSLLSTGTSIFCAVLVNDIANSYLTKIFNLPDSDEPSTKALWSTGFQMVFWWFTCVFTLYCMRNSILHLKAYGTIFGHILGFAGISFFGLICLSEPFNGGPWWDLPVLGIFMITFGALFATSIVHGKLRSASISKESADRWHEQSLDTGTDFLCMTASFILSFFLRFLIINPDLPSIDGSDSGRSNNDWTILMAVGIACVMLAGVIALVRHKVDIPDPFGDIISTTVSLLGAWCCLFAANWAVFTYGGGTVLNRFFVAAIFSVVAYFFIGISSALIMKAGVDKYLVNGLFMAVSLTVGMGWEKTFDACMDGMGDYLGSAEYSVHIELLILMLVFPAWVVYILPKTDDDLKKLPQQHCWAACPCVAPKGDYDDSGSDDADEDELMAAAYPPGTYSPAYPPSA